MVGGHATGVWAGLRSLDSRFAAAKISFRFTRLPFGTSYRNRKRTNLAVRVVKSRLSQIFHSRTGNKSSFSERTPIIKLTTLEMKHSNPVRTGDVRGLNEDICGKTLKRVPWRLDERGVFATLPSPPRNASRTAATRCGMAAKGGE